MRDEALCTVWEVLVLSGDNNGVAEIGNVFVQARHGEVMNGSCKEV